MDSTYQQNNLSILFENPGIFPLSVIHYSNGCVSPQQQTVITVARCPELLFYTPNSFTPDGDETNNSFTISIDTQSPAALSYSPLDEATKVGVASDILFNFSCTLCRKLININTIGNSGKVVFQ